MYFFIQDLLKCLNRMMALTANDHSEDDLNLTLQNICIHVEKNSSNLVFKFSPFLSCSCTTNIYHRSQASNSSTSDPFSSLPEESFTYDVFVLL